MTREQVIEATCAAFLAHYGVAPTAVGVAPGRVELLGNHTDYNDGFVLTAAVDYVTAIAGAPSERPRTHLATSAGFPEATFETATMEKSTGEDRWANYLKGIVDELQKTGTPVGTFAAFVTSSVPDGSGLSSSAALLVAAARLLTTLWPDPLAESPMELAKLARRAENGKFVGAPVGLLDQFSSACGQAGHALFLDCRSFAWRAVPLPAEKAGILLANTNVKHELAAGGGYSERHGQCMQAARQLLGRGDAKLREVTPALLESKGIGLDPLLKQRAHHIVYENIRVEKAAEAMERGDLAEVGRLMKQSHESCRRYFENSCAEVDLLVETASALPGVYGAKLTGGGWGGSAVILHEPAIAETLKAALTESYTAKFGKAPTLLATTAAPGAEGRRL
ncbi:galactokinase [Armatimonas rosea]|uniref:Galactokinase n=1 Tax=Armatimonas rosea TaxID=685828 RepID=A0A7W9W5S1_ARMRO|nr:galactokinase [Armatimonas rosea]MBB6048872.1 galactokinase [Armatimonas rosea]